MPRQPFLPSYSHLQYAVGAKVLNDRPEFASAIGRCISTWSQSDNQMGVLFGILLGTNSEAAMGVFLTLRRSTSQIEALRSAAKFCLSEDELIFFNALIGLYNSLESQRNALAHGCFGVAANDPDALIWIDIKHHVHFQTEVLTNHSQGVHMPDQHKRLKENMYVYKLKDLNVLQNEMEEFHEAARYFVAYLRETDSKTKSNHWSRINNFPLLKSVLNNTSQNNKKA